MLFIQSNGKDANCAESLFEATWRNGNRAGLFSNDSVVHRSAQFGNEPQTFELLSAQIQSHYMTTASDNGQIMTKMIARTLNLQKEQRESVFTFQGP